MNKRVIRGMLLMAALLIIASLLCFSAVAATTVYVSDGKVSVTGSSTTSESGGVVTATAKGGLFSQTTNTITITNETTETIIVSFDYSASNYSSFSESGANGSMRETLVAGESITMSIKGKRALSNNTATLTLSNFSATTAASSYSVNFTYNAALGGIKLNGSAIGNNVTTDVSSSGATLVATANSGVSFLGWIDLSNYKILSTSAEYAFSPTATMNVQAAFSSASTNAWFQVPHGGDMYLYNDLTAACAKASTCDKKVILAANGTLPALDNNQSYTIPSGVTLLIPRNSSNTVYTTTPEVEAPDKYVNASPVLYRKLTMANGAKITVNGAISVAGLQCATMPQNGWVIREYGQIQMNEGSSISISSGGKLYAWGYVTGAGSIEALSGSEVYECFQLADFRGGDGTSKMASNSYGVFPMSQFYLQNIEVPLKLYAEAVEKAYTSFNLTLVGKQGTTVPIIGDSDDGAMFQIGSGYIIKDYKEGTGRTRFEIQGDVSVSSISMTMKLGLLGSTTINSAEFNLPIPGHFTIDAVSGSVDINQHLALLPGSELYVREGATATFGSGIRVIAYSWADWSGYCGAGNAKYTQLSYIPGGGGITGREKDALVQIDGYVDASAGALYVTSGGANIYSTGTGVLKLKIGTETETHQATQAKVDGSQEVTYVGIPVKSPVLRDGGDSNVAATENGTYTYYANTQKWCPPSHRYSDVVTPPTCTTGGYTTHTCIACGNSYTDSEVAALGHTEVIDAAVDATCTESGLTEGKHCSVCGEVIVAQQVVAALGHTEVIDAAVDATCTEAGLTEGKHCSVCGEVIVAQQVVAALGHKEVVDAGKDATCTEPGLTEGKHCSVCGTVIVAQTEIPALGHSYDAVVTEPTCTEQGYTTHTCSICGDSYTDNAVDALGHSYESVVTDPTCVEGGYTTYTCSVCGDFYIDGATDALGHSYTSEVTTEATCLAAGEKTFTCHCGDSYTEEIPRKNHEWGEWSVSRGFNEYTIKCRNGCADSIIVFLEYRLDDYIWLNASVWTTNLSFSMVENDFGYTFAEIDWNDYYIVRKIDAKDLSAKFEVAFEGNGLETPALDISFATYSERLLERYQRELDDSVNPPTEARKKEIETWRKFLAAVAAYGDAAEIYFDKDLKAAYNKDESKVVPDEITMTEAKDTAMSLTNGGESGVTGASLKTNSAKVYFDEALRMSVFFTPTGFDESKIVKIGLLASPGVLNDTGVLTAANHQTMYVLYSLTSPEIPGGSENYPDEDLKENVNNTVTSYNTLPAKNDSGRWELCFDLTNEMYNEVYELRPFVIVEDETGTHYVYGEQVHYSLAAYISRTYAKSTDKAFKNLLTATWDYIVAADAAF